MDCPLCFSSAKLFSESQNRIYYSCGNCELVFLDRRFLLTPDEEKSRYDLHENSLSDPAYRKFLRRLVDPLIGRLASSAIGLDYGCGPVEAMKELFREHGVKVQSFDPYFFPNQKALNEQYDFLILSEVVEHFYFPRKEFEFLKTRLKPRAWVAVSMDIFKEDLNFDSWHYRRDPTHVNFFRESTLQWLAKALGWHLVLRENAVSIFQA